MRHRSLELLSISDLGDVFHILIGCLKTNIVQLTKNISSIRTKWLLKFPVLDTFLWKQRWWKAVQEIPRQTKAERHWAGVQGSARTAAWIQPAARLVHQPRQEWGGVRAEDSEIPSNLNYSTTLNGVGVLMVLSQYWEKLGEKMGPAKSVSGYQNFCRPNHFTEAVSCSLTMAVPQVSHWPHFPWAFYSMSSDSSIACSLSQHSHVSET